MTTLPINSFHQIAIDKIEIPQHFLDLKERARTNLFPWRGQFSPELVGLLLSTYASVASVILDPFAGVGTTLFEAARENLSCHGTEVNPAAIAMAETIVFIGMSAQERRAALQTANSVIADTFGLTRGPLFGEGEDRLNVASRLSILVKSFEPEDITRNVLTNVLIRVCEIENPSSEDVHRAIRQHSEIVDSLPYSTQRFVITNADARRVPLADGSVDLVVTSPPYINVFNYHQNNRPAMELLGWNLLNVAKSEFGSNRKHRQNRFLTVIQYCLDMEAALLELRRVMKQSGRAILVVGRESCVRGVPFQNGALVGALAEQCGFNVSLRQERKFKNRFGEMIYEDIIHLSLVQAHQTSEDVARQIAVEALAARLDSSSKAEAKAELRDAINQASKVKPSPIYVSRQARKPGTDGAFPCLVA